MRSVTSWLLTTLLFMWQPIAAHHNDYACLARDRSVTVEGTIEEFLFADPHVILTIRKNDSTVVTAEWMTMFQLSNGWGITREILGPGDRVVVRGSPYECEQDKMSLLTEVRRLGDGWSWLSRLGE